MRYRRTRETAVRFWIRFQIMKEKRKGFRRDTELIARYEAILDSPEIIDYIVEDPGFETVEAQFEAQPSELGDGKLLEMILEWIDNGGLEKVLEFILKLIAAFA